jgi:hypothetical protein
VEVGYLGVLPLMLAVLAVILRRDSLTRFFAVLALLGLALALGGYAISHGWFYQFAPGFGQLRAPARFVFVMDFALAVLAAFGFDALVREGGALCLTPLRAITRALPLVFLIVAVGAGGTALAILILGQNQDPTIFARIANAVNALAFFLLLFGLSVALLVARATRFFRPRAWSLAALVLIFFDLFSLGAYVDIGTDDPTAAFRHPDLVQFLRSDGTFYRIDARTDIDAAWLPDTAILYSLYDAGGLFNPLQLADTDRYWESLGSRSTPLYDLLNIKYLLARKNTPLDLDKFKLAYEGDLNVYENTRVLPRVFMVYTTRVVADHAAAFAAIHAADFDPRQMLVVENGRALAGQAVGEARIVGYGPNEIVLEANSPREGYLFLSEVYYPGWRALVDEHEEQIVRADYLFRAVYVPAGAHRVRVMFDPWTFRAGAIISGALVVLLAAWGIRMMKK